MLDEGNGAAQEAEDVEPLLEELATVEQQWRREHWANFLGKAVQPQRISITLQVLPDAEPFDIELVVNESLFRQLASIYALWGWSALLDTLALLEKGRSPNPALFGLAYGAALLLRDRIASELASLEAEVGSRALSRWRQTSTWLTAWRSSFHEISYNHIYYRFPDPDTWKKANAALARYHELNRKRRRSENERKGSPGLGRNYVPGVNDDDYPLIARNWGEREKQFQREAADALGELHRVCPAAVMAADATADLFDPTSTWFVPDTLAGDREIRVGGKIVQTLNLAIRQLNELCASLAPDGVAERSAKFGGLAPDTGEDWNTSRLAGTTGLIGAEHIVARRSLDSWDLGNTLRRVVTLRVTWEQALLAFASAPKSNTVMSVLPIVREYALGAVKGKRSLFHACVATHYLHALEGEMETLRAEQNKFQTLFVIINWIAAIVAVVSFVALTFATGGAAAPAGVAAVFAFIESADAVATALVLAFTVVEVSAQSAEAREQWRQAIAGVVQETPETLRSVGSALESMHAMGWKEIGSQVVLMILKQKVVRLADAALGLRLGIPNRMVLFRRTLELSYLADDIGAVATDGAIVFASVTTSP
ncbi:MAG: hypothetical protein IPK33_08530 [Gemmatimonadetes bacterium]|nr:hypothetical protein [Gemmatimonadota bacterium]